MVQIGCDPKSDSTTILRGGNDLPTVLVPLLLISTLLSMAAAMAIPPSA